jgi:peptidoglycan DL-endopeptidase CwlO
MDYKPAIIAAARDAGIDPAIALAVARRESDTQQFWQSGPRKGSLKISPAGAIGIMQVLPSTGRYLGFTYEQLADPQQNIQAGVRYLASLNRQFGSWPQALAAYNWGEGRLRKARQAGRSAPQSVREYVAAVLGPGALPYSQGYGASAANSQDHPEVLALGLLVGGLALVLALK